MKNIVLVVGSYYPNYSAVGVCAHNIVNALKSYDVNISVICQRNDIDEEIEIVRDEVRIVRVTTPINNFKLRHKNKFRFFFNVVRALRYLQALVQKYNVKYDWIDAYFKQLVNLNSQEPIDVIIPCSFPICSVLSTAKFKQQFSNVKVLPFLFDNFVENPDLHRLQINRVLKWKNHISLVTEALSSFDKVLALHTLRKHFEDNYPSCIADKIQYVEHPLLIQLNVSNKKNRKNSINLTYTGNFIKGYVDPDHMIEILTSLIESRDDISVNLYGGGNCAKQIQKFVSISDAVIDNGFIPYDEVLGAMAEADFLISVSENNGIQMSSKIFQYMSLGKPIILFYTAQNDCNLELLRKYPGLFVIKNNDKSFKLENLHSFIDRYSSWSIPFDVVQNLYNDALPSHVAKIIMTYLND